MIDTVIGNAASAWDAEYTHGRYRDEPPVDFVGDILAAAEGQGLRSGVYVGCGNGRNLLPMLDAGLDLTGLDISAEAIGQLRRRRPDRAEKLIVGDLAALPALARYELVIGIQVFQHGTREQAHQHLLAAAERVAAGGLLCVRVNATDTDIEYGHDRTEENPDSGYTVRYRTGPKAGLDIHFFTAAELNTLVTERFTELLAPRLHTTHRTPPSRGHWSQWEAIWQRRPEP
ncbi:MAG TPA: class I SAM-dependent methyltransferase [Pseudonocardiaceae bacterium]|nr:class I SAM-dependent methyltransferase [Pseudonocardiaceae bacterium]